MTKTPKDDSVGLWAKEKLDALRQYLEFYTKVLKNQGSWLNGTIYFDAFAGPGLSRVRTKATKDDSFDLFISDPDSAEAAFEFLKGSPRVALDITNPFTSYIFVDRDPNRIGDLMALKTEYAGTRAITVQEADASVALEAWLRGTTDWRHYRGVVFLDPFGMQVPWSIIEAIAKTKAVEVMINFPLMAIQRLLTRSGKMPGGWEKRLDIFFGSPEWRKLAYHESVDLFGSSQKKVSDAGLQLLEWYRKRLREKFGHVSTPYLIKNTRGNPLYYLVWAGPNRKGLEGADYILSKGEKIRAPAARKAR